MESSRFARSAPSTFLFFQLDSLIETFCTDVYMSRRKFLTGLFNSVDSMLAAAYSSAMVNRYLLWRFDCEPPFPHVLY